jgi:hypothetical protein
MILILNANTGTIGQKISPSILHMLTSFNIQSPHFISNSVTAMIPKGENAMIHRKSQILIMSDTDSAISGINSNIPIIALTKNSVIHHTAHDRVVSLLLLREMFEKSNNVI